MNERIMQAVRIMIFMTVTLIVGLGCGGSGMSHAFDTSLLIVPKEVERAAQEGLPLVLNALSDGGSFQHFNFHSRDEMKKAKVGTPFRVFVASPDVILQGDPKQQLIDCVYPMTIWFFPVISDGEARTILKVYFIENKWKAVGIGDTHLVKPYASVLTKWPSSQGYKHVYVRNNETLSEFVILLHGSETKVVPLYSAMLSWGLKEQRVMEQSEAMTMLRDRFNKLDQQQKSRFRKWR